MRSKTLLFTFISGGNDWKMNFFERIGTFFENRAEMGGIYGGQASELKNRQAQRHARQVRDRCETGAKHAQDRCETRARHARDTRDRCETGARHAQDRRETRARTGARQVRDGCETLMRDGCKMRFSLILPKFRAFFRLIWPKFRHFFANFA